jgi:hypothetical protein
MLSQSGLYLEIKNIFQNIKLNDVIVLDKSVNTNFNKYSTSVQIVGDDFLIIKDHIEKDISQTISRKCIKNIIDNSRCEYLNLTKYPNHVELDRQATDELIQYIIDSGYKKCVLSSMLAACIQDNALFNFKIQTLINGADIYHIGSISNVELYVDPYMRYDDNTIILLNEIRLNIEFVDSRLSNEATFHPRIVIDFNMFSDSDSLVCYVLENKGSPTYLKYISSLRDEKIDNILKKES